MERSEGTPREETPSPAQRPTERPTTRRGHARVALLVALGVAASGLAFRGPAAAQEQPASAMNAEDPFAGTWVLATSMRQAEQERETIIDAAARELSLILRPIGRRRLRTVLKVPRQIVVSCGDVCIGAYHHGMSYDGSWTNTVDPDGHDVRAQRRRSAESITQIYRSDDGAIRHVLRRQGERLVLQVQLTSDQLDNPVRMRLVYRRR